MTSNKNAHNFRHHFWAQFFMLFHLVWFILFGVLGWETTFSLVKILRQPIWNFQSKCFWSWHSEHNGSHHVKEHNKLCSKIVLEFVCIFVLGHLCLWKDEWSLRSCMLTIWSFKTQKIPLYNTYLFTVKKPILRRYMADRLFFGPTCKRRPFLKRETFPNNFVVYFISIS